MLAAVPMRLPPLTRCIRRSALAAVCLLAAAATPALAAYYPSGPQTFVDKSRLDGWQLCFSDLYADTHSLNGILSQCSGDPLMLAGGLNGSQTLTVLAAAPRADVLFDTGTSNTPHDANGSGWYFNDDWSWGFAKQGDPIERAECDDLDGPNPDLRLCWHTIDGGGFLEPGYRAGATQGLNDSTDYARYIYQPIPDLNAFSFAVSGRQLIVSVKTSGSVSVSDAAAPLSASAAKKKRKLFLKPSSASGGPPTIAVPLRLTKAAKSKLKKKGKVKVTARITFTPQGGFPSVQSSQPSTQTAKLTIKGKRKKKK
jgi:hypothetical protein